MTTLALIDYGAGNLHSVHNALRKAGAEDAVITADPALVAKADRIVLPGVGAFRACMDALSAIPGMIDAMNEAVGERGTPFLGVCVGMQLLADVGEEFGRHEGLGWVPGTVRRIEPNDPAIKVPHMGWNKVTLNGAPPLLETGEAYFLHSYHFEAHDPAHVAAVTDHGGPLVAAVARDTIIGCQFHPEKSQTYGLSFLSRFLKWRP
ncbi:imidazole glycerol phosphate synthase subunit HisH [Sphingomonadales bacterium 56]|uniref:imidazole glycerol phosphate synthase subunit HisH n=1 Tax=unclassified Sphingobium TaxID=2611147 RepID=UPI001919EFCD|nr:MULTISPECIES: imidazole glycerol phosphate synthase subunit HisH [unclassified Sphingobium]MBY2928030.1 imidazole glycerol phosphate synthase subunit HisH [Sphingomonadales bacterium 56]MBY2958130.1 imidazole glycerol phosphate synthase subunit HisH [Sphingomonadales bacterium 58]CAD7336426.1 Imidazole glycerol phosphate synthase subunit HisH [Sphingobium sp. S6]CAD7336487.1 Imidazole glycerol phosphate synthase subunit HisH [Sphingobium sp. S8]